MFPNPLFLNSLLLTAAFAGNFSLLAANVTFHKDIEPILQRHCQGCHRAGEAGPMALTTYAETRPWAKAIKNSVATRKMPPWFATAGHFRNDRRMSEADIQAIAAWADAGAPAGDPKDAPKPVQFSSGWGLGQPDVVFEMPQAFEIPAQGEIDYQYVIIPTGFTEDKWIQAVESRPGNRALTHHVIAFVRPPQSPWLKGMKPGEIFTMNDVPKEARRGIITAEWLNGYAPGTPAEILADGQAKLVPAGSDLVLQLHYTATGKAGTDRSKVAMVFAKQAPRERVLTLPADNTSFKIPRGAANHAVPFSFTIKSDARLLGFVPHMHARGKAMSAKLVTADGVDTPLIDMRWDFNWQLWYELADPIALQPGAKVEAVAYFDNSANNPFNPDPTKEVHWGEQTWEEMAMFIMNVAIDAKKDPMELYRGPKKPQAAVSSAGER
jgi:hypothetical protein